MSQSIEPMYTTVDSVKIRLAGKVQFQSDDGLLDGELPNALLCQLINDGETEVEQDLRTRYAIPFQSKTTKNYSGLPDHTKRAIRVAVDMMAVMKVLETDFGRGSAVNGENYYKNLKTHYDEYMDRLLGRDRMAANAKIDRYKFSPPLADLLLAPTNSEADDGFRGMIINTDQSERDASTYAEEQVNNPGHSYVGSRRGGLIV